MFSMLLSSLMAIFLSFLIMILGVMLSMRASSDREKSSPFECGFDPVKSARIPFSLRFFLLAIIFLIFDVEVVLLFPIVLMYQYCVNPISFVGSWLFLMILLAGVVYEWNEGSLDWAQ